MALKCISLFLIISFSKFAVGQNFSETELLQRVIESKPVLEYSTKKISKQVKSAYKEKFNIEIQLSNPGEAYNSTDVVYKNEPFGMLLFLGAEANNAGFILFEAKGVKSQCYLIFYRLKRKKVRHMNSVILKKQPSDFEELKRVIRDSGYF